MIPIELTPLGHAEAYNMAFPDRVPLSEKGGMVGGCWMIGACYKNPSRMSGDRPFYGGYPRGYLERVHSMFPDARSVLHVFSGGLTFDMAAKAFGRCLREKCYYCGGGCLHGEGCSGHWAVELVDLGGEGRHPTWRGNVLVMPERWAERFDLVLADPPYSAEDAKRYGVDMPLTLPVMIELHRVTKPGGNLVWLDAKWPMHSKALWKTWATIGLVRSTNHRMRLVSMFRRQP